MNKHLRLFRVDPAAWVGSQAACLAVLDDDELARLDENVRPAVRHEQLVTRALVRWALSRMEPIPPEDWRFEREPGQRPRVLGSGLSFSVSHTEGQIVCLAGRGRFGVDVQETETRPVERFGHTVLHPDERELLDGLDPEAWRDEFHRLFTLKEAYAKALGLGLRLPFETVSFAAGPPPGWSSASRRLSDEHVISIVAHGPADLEAVLTHVTPIMPVRADLPAEERRIRLYA